ncbi:MAG TPA: alpha/beta hydrolase [Stellaceae bacterium]|nr:alpha/beta hydrolase [Stellaceae bacterium]
MPVYRDYDQAELDAQLNPRAATPSFFHHFRRWGEASAAARAARAAELDLAYGHAPAEKLDFFRVPGLAAPLLVFIHGGDWHSLDKADFAFLAPAFLDRGIAVALVNYGHAPATPLAEMVEQIRRAIAYLYRQAAALDIDPTRIHLAGHGAGAQLAMAALVPSWRPYELLGNPIQGALGLSGLYDLEPVRLSYLNAALGLDHEAAERWSPLHLPPPRGTRLLLAAGGRDSFEFRRQLRAFAGAWGDQGAAVEMVELPGEDHFSLLARLAEPDSTLCRALLPRLLAL